MSQAEFEYLGPYHVDRILGRGGMGSVYQGVHVKSGDPVAIKVIATGIANQSRFRRRFATEIEALKRLKHPHIVELIGYGEEKGILFYSMEYVAGHSLHDHLRQHGTLPWEDVVQVAIETTSALQHAHNIGIIHRDLKPANLMLNSEGHVKLTDFGISKLFGSNDETAVGSVIGTADYMPPEQAEGKPVNTRSDLYSLGSVMYALLVGKAPFGGKSVPEVLYSVRYNPVPDLAAQVSNVPEDLIALIHELLEKDPSKRPPTALVVGNRLKALQQGMQRRAQVDEKTEPRESLPSATRNELGTELTSLDLSDVEDAELRLTGEEPQALGAERSSAEETHPGGSPLGTHEQRTLVAPERPSAEQRPAKASYSSGDDTQARSVVDRTSQHQPKQGPSGMLGESAASFEFIDESTTAGGPSHYTPVSGPEQRPFVFGEKPLPAEAGTDWVHVGSIVGIVVLLVTSIGAGWWMLQPQSANELYGTISKAVDAGDDGQLLAASGSIQEFLTRFPKDERAAEVRALADEAELIRRIKLLQRKAAQAGGVERLSAIEQAFLDSVETRAQSADEAQRKLTAFVTVFGQIENLNPSDQRLVELAEFSLSTGENVVVQQKSAAKAQLEKLIQSAEKALSGQALETYYRDLLLLYDDQPWADEQTSRIRKKLEAES